MIKVYSKNGKSKVLSVSSFTHIEKIAKKFDRWEYLK